MTEGLDKNFIVLTGEIADYLRQIKRKFDQFDSAHVSQYDRITFVKENSRSIFNKLTENFKAIWLLVKEFKKAEYSQYQKYYQKALLKYFLVAEINKYIYSQPLGYAGDFRMMNYILDYHSVFLGKSSFEMLINHYTCNISISQSNIKRKDFLKNKILEVLNSKDYPSIISIGGGPLRELIELLSDDEITTPLRFYDLDFEPEALEFVKDRMGKIDGDKKKNITINYINLNIKDLLKSKSKVRELENHDLIYISGVFDYLSDTFCSRLLSILWEMLKENGEIIIYNVNLEGQSLRAYFELLGGWKMNFRSKADMLSWTESLDRVKTKKFEQNSPLDDYLILSLHK
jgi:hypothetical protein